jgi:hypothetical protein
MPADSTHSTPKKGRNELRQSRERFIAALRNTANVRASAQAAGVDRKTAYNWRNTSTAFAAQWDEAIEDAVDTLEAAAVKRARDGVEEPVYQGGEMVGTVTKYSDTLLIFLMKAHRPKMYRETVKSEITGPDGGPMVMLQIDK